MNTQMTLTKEQLRKRRYFAKVYDQAKTIPCGCGCGALIKDHDRYGRAKTIVSGHNGRKYEDPRQYKREWNHRHRRYRYNLKRKHCRNKKIRLIALHGNRCMRCHIIFDNNACIFDFHHRNSHSKLFNLNSSFNKYSWEKIVKEAKKCDMLCANCHRMVERGKYQ